MIMANKPKIKILPLEDLNGELVSTLFHNGKTYSLKEIFSGIPNYDPCKIKNNKYFFDIAEAQRWLDFFNEVLFFTEGDRAALKENFHLEFWQISIIANLVGWRFIDENGLPCRRYRTGFIYLPRKNGKALDLEEVVPTPDGWKKIKELEIGDKLYNPYGLVIKVKALHPIHKAEECFKITFSNDQTIICNGDHLWKTTSINDTLGTQQKIRSAKDIYESQKFGVKNDLDRYVIKFEPFEIYEIVKVEKIKSKLVRCITIDSEDGMFLVGRTMIPTHNSPMVAGLALAAGFLDNEPGFQIYSVAADKEQASITYRHMSSMIDKNEWLQSKATVRKAIKGIEFEGMGPGCIYKALSADAETKHGLNVHWGIIEELHAQPDGELAGVISTGTASRRQPMILYVTTADFQRESACNRVYAKAKSVCDGTIEDDTYLPVIYEAFETDDWTSEETWRKSNPNYGISVKPAYIESAILEAERDIYKQNEFKRLHLNIRTTSESQAFSVFKWRQCNLFPSLDHYDIRYLSNYRTLPDNYKSIINNYYQGTYKYADHIPEEDDKTITPAIWKKIVRRLMKNEECVVGVDLSSSKDLTAAVFWFPAYNIVIPEIWCPADSLKERQNNDKIPYYDWHTLGFIRKTDGNMVDYQSIFTVLMKYWNHFSIRMITADPWNSLGLLGQLQNSGLPHIKYQQGFANMNDPIKYLEECINNQSIHHGNNPVLSWALGNCVSEIDNKLRRNITKGKCNEKIDPIIALLMAIGYSNSDNQAIAEKDEAIKENKKKKRKQNNQQ